MWIASSNCWREKDDIDRGLWLFRMIAACMIDLRVDGDAMAVCEVGF